MLIQRTGGAAQHVLGSNMRVRSGGGGAASTLLTGITEVWHLDESSAGVGAVTRAASIGANDLTDLNTTPSGTGKNNNGCDFERGNNEALNRASTTDIQLGNIDFTYALWVRPESANTMYMLSKGTSTASAANYAFLLFLNSTYKVTFTASNGITGVNHASTESAIEAQWNLVIIKHDATNDKIFIKINNGTIKEFAYAAGIADGSTLPFKVACAPATLGLVGGSPLDGVLDEIMFWKKVLTETEDAELWNGGTGKFYPFS